MYSGGSDGSSENSLTRSTETCRMVELHMSGSIISVAYHGLLQANPATDLSRHRNVRDDLIVITKNTNVPQI